jgi:hypothetical protein
MQIVHFIALKLAVKHVQILNIKFHTSPVLKLLQQMYKLQIVVFEKRRFKEKVDAKVFAYAIV